MAYERSLAERGWRTWTRGASEICSISGRRGLQLPGRDLREENTPGGKYADFGHTWALAAAAVLQAQVTGPASVGLVKAGDVFVILDRAAGRTRRRTLGSVPQLYVALHRKETWRDVGIRAPKGVVEKSVNKGIEQQSQAAIVFTGPFQYDRDHRVAIRALGMVLDTKLREVLREDLSGTYGVSVSPGYTIIPRQEYSFTIRFGCDPKRTDELVKVIFQEIENLKKSGPSEKQVSDVMEALLRDFETNVTQNSYLLGQIYLRYQVPQDLGEYFNLPEYYMTLNATMILEAARAYLNTDDFVKVTLFPESKSEAPSKKEDQEGLPVKSIPPAA